MAIETKPWDAAEFLDTEEDVREFLAAALEDGDPAVIRSAFNTIARARGMSALSAQAGVSREALYKAFGHKGNPTLETLLKVTKALGVKLSIAPASH